MKTALPFLAIALGVAGLLPLAASAVGTVEASQAVQQHHYLTALVSYAAEILAFVGAVHWGFALQDNVSARPQRAQLVLGVIPALIGWIALLVGDQTTPWWAIVLLIAGLVLTLGFERRAARAGLMPPGYLGLRWALTIASVLILGAVLVLHLLGVGASGLPDTP